MLTTKLMPNWMPLYSLLFIALLCIPSALQAELVCVKLKNASPTSKRATKLSVVRTSESTCPKGSEEIIDTDVLTGPKGETGASGAKGDTGASGPAGSTGPAGADGVDGIDGVDGDMNVLCYARIDMDTDTVTSFGGNGTTNVSAVQAGGINLNTVTCTGSYPGVSSLNDLVLFANQSTNASTPPGPTVIDLSSSSASSSSIVVHVRSSDGDEHYNILVLGPTS